MCGGDGSTGCDAASDECPKDNMSERESRESERPEGELPQSCRHLELPSCPPREELLSAPLLQHAAFVALAWVRRGVGEREGEKE